MNKGKVGFDIDGCLLDRSDVQQFAKELSSYEDIEIHIVTSRFEHKDINGLSVDNTDIFKLAYDLGIDEENIHFTNHDWKSEFYKYNYFIWHIDDCLSELASIQQNTNVGFLHVNNNYRDKGLKLINLWRINKNV